MVGSVVRVRLSLLAILAGALSGCPSDECESSRDCDPAYFCSNLFRCRARDAGPPPADTGPRDVGFPDADVDAGFPDADVDAGIRAGDFDPGHVHLLGWIGEAAAGHPALWDLGADDPSPRIALPSGGLPTAVALSAPDRFMFYVSGGVLRVMQPETWTPGAPYPADGAADDPTLPTPPCARVADVLVSADGRRLHRCDDRARLYDARGESAGVDADQVLGLGTDGQLVLRRGDRLVLQRSLVDAVPIPEPGPDEVRAVRAVPNGFWLATETQLLRLDLSSTVTVAGDYAPTPSVIDPRPPYALDARGNLHHLAARCASCPADRVVRRSLRGPVEVILRDQDDPPVRVSGEARLVTGP
jgi:hypothetical protein